jgi:hypothetical protein
MAPHVLVDADGNELGRCGFESGVDLRFTPGHVLGLGPMGYFRILESRGGDPFVLVVEPVEPPAARSSATGTA